MRWASFFFFFFFFSPRFFAFVVRCKGEDGSNVIVTVLRSAFRNLSNSFLRFDVINHLLELIISIRPWMCLRERERERRTKNSLLDSSTREERDEEEEEEEKKKFQIFQRRRVSFERRSEEFLIY